MINHSILESFYVELINLSNNSTKSSDKKQINKLLGQLKKATVFDEIKLILATHDELVKKNSQSFFSTTALTKKLHIWQKQLLEIDLLLPTIIDKVDAIIPTAATKFLLSLLKDILINSDCKLHCQMGSLLKQLCDVDLNDLLDYLCSLKKAPIPEIILPGSFIAAIAHNESHSACIACLNNIAAVQSSDNQHSLWILANSILQNLLLIYQDLHDNYSSLCIKSPLCIIL